MKIALAVAMLAMLPVQPVARSCGLQPIAPKGCQVNSCVCDSLGSNCHWIYFCGYCCGYNSRVQPFYEFMPNYGNALDMFRIGGRPRAGVLRPAPNAWIK